VTEVMQQKLPPGAKLPEGPLCEAFDCSRTRIRRILIVLAERGVVTLCTNCGAFVSSPKEGEARDVFVARRC
jgi:DNA-binding GntR family transcriptional regulator